jgi:hypothetical protein
MRSLQEQLAAERKRADDAEADAKRLQIQVDEFRALATAPAGYVCVSNEWLKMLMNEVRELGHSNTNGEILKAHRK